MTSVRSVRFSRQDRFPHSLFDSVLNFYAIKTISDKTNRGFVCMEIDGRLRPKRSTRERSRTRWTTVWRERDFFSPDKALPGDHGRLTVKKGLTHTRRCYAEPENAVKKFRFGHTTVVSPWFAAVITTMSRGRQQRRINFVKNRRGHVYRVITQSVSSRGNVLFIRVHNGNDEKKKKPV